MNNHAPSLFTFHDEQPVPAAAPHLCHAVDCTVKVPPKMLMCRRHWAMVPRDVQALVWHVYVPGQEIRKDPTRRYLAVAELAIACALLAEGWRALANAKATKALGMAWDDGNSGVRARMLAAVERMRAK